MNTDPILLDPFTFGDSKAAVNLADMLNKLNDRKITSYISSVIHHFCFIINQIEKMDNAKARSAILNLIRNSMKSAVKNDNVPQIIKDHTMNVIVAKYKIAMRRVVRLSAEQKELERIKSQWNFSLEK